MRQSIDSIILQTYKNWELLIVDDGSTDQTAKIAAEYEKKDSRILYFKNPENLRLPRTLNRGFSLAKGDFLTWTSDDNYYYPNALEKMLNALTLQQREFVFASCDIVDAAGKIVECISVGAWSVKRIVGCNPVGACFMYSRKVYETIGEYDPELALVEDFDYWQRICMEFTPVCLSEKLYAYRWHDAALTSTMKKDLFNRTLEKCLLKNRAGFGKIGFEEKYYYYKGLYTCRTNLGERRNPYKVSYQIYSFLYFWLRRVPNKIKRIFTSTD